MPHDALARTNRNWATAAPSPISHVEPGADRRAPVAQPMPIAPMIRDGYALVTAHGEVDIATEARLLAAAREALAACAGHPLILDLSRLTFLSSSGFGHLVALHEQAAAAGVPLRIVVGDAWAVFRPFAVMGLHDVLAVFRTTQAAIDVDTPL